MEYCNMNSLKKYLQQNNRQENESTEMCEQSVNIYTFYCSVTILDISNCPQLRLTKFRVSNSKRYEISQQ